MLACLAYFGALAGCCCTAHAQYREHAESGPSEARFLSIGYLQRTFDPQASNTLGDTATISYDRMMPVAGLRQGVLDMLIGYARYSLQGESKETILIAANVRQELPLAGGKETMLLAPLMLATDYVKAESAGPQRETFSVASVGIGAGMKLRQVGSGYDASVEVLAAAHYSIDGLGTGSGFSPALIAEAGVFLPDALSFASLAAGYRLRLQSWNMSDDKLDYQSVSHGPYVGVWF
jgi:hypothetical protein